MAHQVKARREGKSIYYSLDDQHVIDILEEALIHIRHKISEAD
jgi:ArsR family transcriptional regulator